MFIALNFNHFFMNFILFLDLKFILILPQQALTQIVFF